MSDPKPARFDVDEKTFHEQWGTKLNVTPTQLREAGGAVDTLASDVELHLKGSRSTTNDERVEHSGTEAQ